MSRPRRAEYREAAARPRGKAWVALIVAASVLLGAGLALVPTTALFSSKADVDDAIIAAGDLNVRVDPDYSWSLSTDPGGASVISEGTSDDPGLVDGLWVDDGVYVNIYWTGTATLVGDNIRAKLLYRLDGEGTLCAEEPGSCELSVVDVEDGAGSPANAGNLTQGVYSFTLWLQADGEDVAYPDRFGGDPFDQVLTLGKPAVTLEQVRP